MPRILWLSCSLLLVAVAVAAESTPRSKSALLAFNDLIGSWRATGTPEGTRQEKQQGFWTETVSWEWQFKGDDAWLRVAFDKGKYFDHGELRFLPEKQLYQLALSTSAKEALTFVGRLQDRRLILERDNAEKHETERLIITLLHTNRFLYSYEVKPQGRSLFTRLYQVGCTKEGVPFAEGDGRPECIVTGGLGTIAVSYKGQTYHVCCSGCRSAFQDDPEKFISEYKARKAEEAKKAR